MIKAFCGRFGSGKTLSMVHEALPWIKRNFRIVSNTPVRASRYYLFNPIEMIRRKNVGEWRYTEPILVDKIEDYFDHFAKDTDTIFLMDEAALWLNSYKWDKVPDEVYNRFLQPRKYNVHFLYTTQFFNFVAKKLRQVTDVSVECSVPLRGLANKKIPYDQGRPVLVRQIAYNPLYYDQKIWSLDVEKKYIDSRRFIFGGRLKELFGSYDTKKAVGGAL